MNSQSKEPAKPTQRKPAVKTGNCSESPIVNRPQITSILKHPHLPKCLVDTPMFIDQATIATRLLVKEELGSAQRNGRDSLPADMRHFVHDIIPGKTRRDRWTKSLVTPIKVIVDPKCGIRLYCTKHENGLVMLDRITINPGRILFGQNGSVITEREFGKVLSLLVVQVKPLLDNPDDWVQLIPGLSETSKSRWALLEIAFQIYDPDSKFLKLVGCSKHREISLTPQFRRADETITFQNSTKELTICVYRKDLEASNRQKLNLRPGSEHVTRVEVRLGGKKLFQHMPSATWRNDGKKSHLIQFSGEDLFAAWMSVISGFSSVSTLADQKDGPAKFGWGRFLGFLSVKFDIEFAELISALMEMKGPMPKKNATQFIDRISKTARDEISLLLKQSIHAVATPAAWFSQPDVLDDEVLESTAKRLNSLPVKPDLQLTDGLYS